MKTRLLYATFLLVFAFFSCKKDKACTPKTVEEEEPQIAAYITKDSIGAQKFSNTIYYKIMEPGDSVRPTKTSKIIVTYTAKMLNNTTFDAAPVPVTVSLKDVIEGWQIGLPLIQKHGRILLIIPSVYAYGCVGNSNLNVPADAVLVYDIRLLDVL